MEDRKVWTITGKNIIHLLKKPATFDELVKRFGFKLELRHVTRLTDLVTRLQTKGELKEHTFTLTEIKDGAILKTPIQGLVAS